MTQGIFGRLQSEIEAREKVAGFSTADLLELAEPQRTLMRWMMRHGRTATLNTLASGLGEPPDVIEKLIEPLVERGFIRAMQVGKSERYQLRFARRQGSKLSDDIWQILDQKLDE